ncbi:MAG: diaminopimelate decarboxylase [Desulfarculaceae bacterium]|nr:diaminopimelate decarboxylase [Desulfarculaceae bacterium]MCF8048197.1 diaminopimelate decarboxylase [Desulfarculaceae bacterium]MCF8065147.1 diaminopimelate decarboxylase [Desulfarculaceae bacterium]MCF8096801.1 diaminopimelate decarboxylase [Desulfarculaceae bacterium]MCF8122617.1 diaminopimelate decarboxylase [Desulfarculaceae bacterium]
MHHFSYKNGELYAEDVPLATIADQVGTPVYIYSQATLERHFKAFDQAFEGLDHVVCFAVKANSNQAVIATMARLGAGADIVTGGELARSMAAGVPAERIVYSGVGKSEAEMRSALEAGILMFNIESAQELAVLNEVAGSMGKKAPVSLRVNPDVDAQTHPKITTGLSKNKFGMDIDLAFKQYQEAAKLPNVELKGVSCHIGSQLTKVEPFADALERVGVLIGRLRGAGIELELLDLGGGLGITYDQEEPPSPAQYADALKEQAGRLGLKLVLEPGRVIVGNAGIMMCKVLFTKDTPTKHFIIVDAGMNDLVRPAMYDSFQAIWPVNEDLDRPQVVSDVVGPICETGDFLARDRGLPDMHRGELVAVMSAGAYGFSMSSTYNSRPRVAEVMVSGDRWSVVRRRETTEELMRGESLPKWMD